MEEQNYEVRSENGPKPEVYLDIEEAARVLKLTRGELTVLVERRLVPAHKLQHGKRYCWKFKRSELESELRRRNGEVKESEIQ